MPGNSIIKDNRVFSNPGSDGTNGTIEWLLAGNTTGGIKKLGTLDAYEVSYVTNNIERMVIKNTANNGAVGIGANAHLGVATTKFWVSGESQFGDNIWVGGGTGEGVISFSAGTSFSIASRGTNILALKSNSSAITFMTGSTEIGRMTSGADFGLGIAVPVARFHNFGALVNINQRLEPAAGITEDTRGATLNTTDSTVTTLETVPVPTTKVITIRTTVNARCTGGSGATTGDGAGYIRTATFRNVAGTVTQISTTQADYTKEEASLAACDVTFVVSGTDVLIKATGINTVNLTWNSITKVFTV